MKNEHKEILEILTEYLEKNECLRFGQALRNLSVNEFAKDVRTEEADFTLRDIYNDSDKAILERMKLSQN